MRESCSWEGNTYAKYIFNPHRSWRDGSGSPTGTRIVDKAYAAKRLLDSIYGIRNCLQRSYMERHRNSIEYEVWGRYALFSEVATRVGGEKYSYQVPTYQALKGITESIYWKPTFKWVIDAVRVMNKIQTESRGVRTIVYQPKKKNVKNDLSYYTYLKDVRYQVLAHFEWNDLREELADDRDENKHHNIAMRSVRQGGRRDIFLGARECQAYVEPCEFGGGEGFYDSYGEWNMGYMFHGFSYPDENPDHNLISRFWMPIMKDGVIRFESPDSPLLDRHIVRHGLNVKEFNLGKNVTSVEEE